MAHIDEAVAEQLEVSWRPTPEYIARSNLRRFMDRYGLADYEALQRWSVKDIGWFWDAVSEDLELDWYSRTGKSSTCAASSGRAGWSAGSSTTSTTRSISTPRPSRQARARSGRARTARRRTHLRGAAGRGRTGCANALRALGRRQGRPGRHLHADDPGGGDRHARLPASSGAIYIPIFSGYGAEAVASRLQDCEAKLLITADGFYRRGKLVPMKEIADEAVAPRRPSSTCSSSSRAIGREVPVERGPRRLVARRASPASRGVRDRAD